LDYDQDQDILLVSENGLQVEWLENSDGQGKTWRSRFMAGLFQNQPIVTVADIDGDLDQDVVIDSDNLAWYENTGAVGRFVVHDVDKLTWPFGVLVHDVDRDGDADLLKSNGWYRNTDGKGKFEFGYAWQLAIHAESRLADIDGDGDRDVVFDTHWQENLSDIGIFAATVPLVAGATPVFKPSLPIDFDRDGDVDVITLLCTESVPCFRSRLVYLENLGNGTNFAPPRLIRNDDTDSLELVDLDNGAVDNILAAFPDDNQVVWFRYRPG
jgi:hypothetical protein